jgi:hypothetical protein
MDMLKFKELKKLFLSGLKTNPQTYIINIDVPINSTEWDIDDFLGNSFQYKVGNKWYYDTSVKLPNHHTLRIKGISEKSNSTNKIVEIEASY